MKDEKEPAKQGITHQVEETVTANVDKMDETEGPGGGNVGKEPWQE